MGAGELEEGELDGPELAAGNGVAIIDLDGDGRDEMPALDTAPAAPSWTMTTTADSTCLSPIT